MNFADDLVPRIDERCKQLCINRSAYINMAVARQLEMDAVMLNLLEMVIVLNSLAGGGSVGFDTAGLGIKSGSSGLAD